MTRRNHTRRHRQKKSNSGHFTRSKPGWKNALRQLKRSVKRSGVRRKGGQYLLTKKAEEAIFSLIQSNSPLLINSRKEAEENARNKTHDAEKVDIEAVVALDVKKKEKWVEMILRKFVIPKIYRAIVKKQFTKELYISDINKQHTLAQTRIQQLTKTRFRMRRINDIKYLQKLEQEKKLYQNQLLFKSEIENLIETIYRHPLFSEELCAIEFLNCTSNVEVGEDVLHKKLKELLELQWFDDDKQKRTFLYMYTLWNYSTMQHRILKQQKQDLSFEIIHSVTTTWREVIHEIQVYTGIQLRIYKRYRDFVNLDNQIKKLNINVEVVPNPHNLKKYLRQMVCVLKKQDNDIFKSFWRKVSFVQNMQMSPTPLVVQGEKVDQAQPKLIQMATV